jgi:DNA-binding IclR family transcriptional regulator
MSSTAAKSAARALDVLQALARTGTPMSAHDIAAACAIPKSSAYELLKVMQTRRFVEYSPASRRWSLDVATLEIASAYRRSGALQQKCWAHLAKLTEQTGHTSHLAVLDGPEVLYLAKREPAGGGIHLVTEVGTRLPAQDTAVGRAILAHLERDELAHALVPEVVAPLNDRTSARWELLDALPKVRARGVAEDIGGVTPGITCVAAPVFGHDGRVVAAVGVSYVSATEDAAGHRSVERVTREAAHDLTQQLSRPTHGDDHPRAPELVTSADLTH